MSHYLKVIREQLLPVFVSLHGITEHVKHLKMKILYPYLRQYWKLVALALFLAAVNQVFSLLDPVVFRHVIDDYATKPGKYTESEFFAGVLKLLALAVG